MSRELLLPLPTRVVLLTGPSGSGKSSLAARSGLPVLRLDDFYKEGDDPTLPLVEGSSDIDWDSPLSWDAQAAVAAIAELCGEGRTEVPVYSIATSSRTGSETLDIARTPLFIAEGIFAADIVARCQELGLLADAICLRGRPSTTFHAAAGAGSARGAQVGAVPAAQGLAADAGGAGHRGPAHRARRVRLRPRRGARPPGCLRGGPPPHGSPRLTPGRGVCSAPLRHRPRSPRACAPVHFTAPPRRTSPVGLRLPGAGGATRSLAGV